MLLISIALYFFYSSWEAFVIAAATGLYQIYYNYATAWNKIYARAILPPLAWLLFLLSILYLYSVGNTTLEGLAYAYFLSNSFFAFFLLKDLLAKFSLAPVDVKEYLSYGFAAALTNQRNYVFNALDTFIIGTFFGMDKVMLYQATVEPFRRIINGLVKPYASMLTAHLPLLEVKERLSLVWGYLKKYAFLLVVPFLLYPLLPTIEGWIAPQYKEYWLFAFIYLLSLYAVFSVYLSEAYFKSMGEKKVLSMVAVGGALFNAVFSFAGALTLGIAGPVLSTTLSWWLMALAYLYSLKQRAKNLSAP